MKKKLYVGNLSFQTTETELKELFAQSGQADTVRIITDRETGRSKGFGFVEMEEGGDHSRSKVEQNTLALAASLKMMGVGFEPLAEILTEQFMRKGGKVVTQNLEIARLGYDYAAENFQPFALPIPMSDVSLEETAVVGDATGPQT